MKTVSVIRSKRGLIPKSDKIRYGGVFLIVAWALLALCGTGEAFEIETDSDWQLRMNGYADLQ